ncbi:hypothetical protein CKO28_17445 [Rhodovibrio sodomensis]|uniref:Uncharacterized protein n=1 Tax=Rhodovibrio sodomensis TaxID=1088 RepID=A0ABS1DHQ7_9PROT|nr:hypothetical protein [Rhodovibrio sodomensis]MBK1669823.1 hypothetical protein [Rhodovibrio sodomensis]
MRVHAHVAAGNVVTADRVGVALPWSRRHHWAAVKLVEEAKTFRQVGCTRVWRVEITDDTGLQEVVSDAGDVHARLHFAREDALLRLHEMMAESGSVPVPGEVLSVADFGARGSVEVLFDGVGRPRDCHRGLFAEIKIAWRANGADAFLRALLDLSSDRVEEASKASKADEA